MSSDMDQVFHDENDQRRREDTLDVQQEMMMAEQDALDKDVLMRVRRGETTIGDYHYLKTRLNAG